MLRAAVPFAALSGVVTVTPAQLHWESSNDLPPGAKTAVVEGVQVSGNGLMTMMVVK